MRSRQTKTRILNGACRALGQIATAVACATLLSACGAPLARRPATEPIVEGEAGSWSLVMNSPSVAMALADIEPRRLPEYSRNDRALNVRTFGPLTASNQWPEPQRPSLAFSRRVYLNPRADTVLFFETEPRGYRGSRSNYGPSGYPGDGAWGGWR
ncbi:MAG: hypothetical protein K2W85_04335 [Phycisphaerales bacterium]|nr:hypothetical protein [Phycisphaerales bacterium]